MLFGIYSRGGRRVAGFISPKSIPQRVEIIPGRSEHLTNTSDDYRYTPLTGFCLHELGYGFLPRLRRLANDDRDDGAVGVSHHPHIASAPVSTELFVCPADPVYRRLHGDGRSAEYCVMAIHLEQKARCMHRSSSIPEALQTRCQGSSIATRYTEIFMAEFQVQ